MRYSFFITIFLGIAIFLSSCSERSGIGIFAKRSLHEQYGAKLKDAGLANSTLAKQWFAAADSRSNLVNIKLPYQERGYFPADKPKTSLLQFQATKGEKITVKIERKATDAVRLFADLWQLDANELKAIASLDSIADTFGFETSQTGDYLLRIQPELLSSGEYLLQITKGPSLAFPVQGKNSIQSKWGDGRDNNTRKHEGVDIFAARGTPALAAADGTVTRVGTNNLGGNIVFMRPVDRSYNLYYAHLDKQLVQDGQQVRLGDTLGLVGNTGNAITTTPHLHFGIYEYGAVDPEPFINVQLPTMKRIIAPFGQVGSSARIKNSKTISLGSGNTLRLPAHTIVWIDAANENNYKATLPNDQLVWVSSNDIAPIATIRKTKLPSSQNLFDKPDLSASAIATLEKDSTVDLLGTFGAFNFVKQGDLSGWIAK